MPEDRRAVSVAWTGFVLIGWAGVLVPSLVREVEARFGVGDAALGIWYFATSLAYAAASFAGGALTDRLGRRRVLGSAALILAVGLGLQGASPSWPLFFLAGPLGGLGAGAVDGGMNGLVLAVAGAGRARALNLLHLCFSIGAFVAPFVVGRLVSAGADWQLILLATGSAGALIAVALWIVPMPSGRRSRGNGTLVSDRDAAATGLGPDSGRRPLVLLGVAIAAYVAGEIGVSNWVVRFLDRATLDTATLALSAFWAGLALGRLTASRVADRVPHGQFAAASAFVAGLAVVIAVLSPSIEVSIAALFVAGFASGPIFPMIIAIGGDLYPNRLASIAGTLTAVAVVGGTLYPPVVGLLSSSLGIGAGMLGAGALSIVSGAAVLAATSSGSNVRPSRTFVG